MATSALRLDIRKTDRGDAYRAWLLLLPVLLFFALFQYYPIVKSILISFQEYGLLLENRPWVGFRNFHRQFRASDNQDSSGESDSF